MRILNYIGEFFLFRWLYGKLRKSPTKHDAHIENLENSIDNDSKYLNDNHNEDIAPIEDTATSVSDNLIDDSNSSEDLYDLDIFMRDNTGNNHTYLNHGDYGRDYINSGRRSGHHDWESGSYSQSYNDFHDEQDDYDMMDDDF